MTVWNPTDDGHADLSSHDSFVAGAPHNTFKRLRDEDPMAWCDWADGKGFWSVTRHADILELNRHYQRLSSAQGIRMEDQSREEYLARRTSPFGALGQYRTVHRGERVVEAGL